MYDANILWMLSELNMKNEVGLNIKYIVRAVGKVPLYGALLFI